jgi:hypothetical protein
MTEMKICRKPYVRHLSCELPGDPVPSQWSMVPISVTGICSATTRLTDWGL